MQLEVSRLATICLHLMQFVATGKEFEIWCSLIVRYATKFFNVSISIDVIR